MKKVLLALLLLTYLARAEEPTPPVPTQSLEEIRTLLQGIKSKSKELGKLQNALQQMEAQRDAAVSVTSDDFNPDNCGEYRGAFQVQKCVLHSVREMKKLSDEIQ